MLEELELMKAVMDNAVQEGIIIASIDVSRKRNHITKHNGTYDRRVAWTYDIQRRRVQ